MEVCKSAYVAQLLINMVLITNREIIMPRFEVEKKLHLTEDYVIYIVRDCSTFDFSQMCCR
jgi:hypothetical protein